MINPMQKKAIVLISGGIDSATCLALAKSQGFDCYALSFDYGQRHAIELEAAKQIAQQLGVIAHRVIKLDTSLFAGSSLTDKSILVPDYDKQANIQSTYVPARNTIFLSLTLGWAETLAIHNIFIGSSYADYNGYPDCRPEYFKAFETMANLATKSGAEGTKFQIHAPITQLTKAETIQLGIKLGIDYSATITCYQPDAQGRACGRCVSCVPRKEGFKAAGIIDPTKYQ